MRHRPAVRRGDASCNRRRRRWRRPCKIHGKLVAILDNRCAMADNDPLKQRSEIDNAVHAALSRQPVVDIHTHLYPPSFGTTQGGKSGKSDPSGLLLWGIDELLTYHYLVAEVFRAVHAD